MLKQIKTGNVGPAPIMDLEFGERLNILTGDNGLGKSFLLDIAWWALTRKWPAEINPKLTTGKKALPEDDATIAFSFSGRVREEQYESRFLRRELAWTGRSGRPANPGLVLYAMSDGSFAVWDPARNYWRTQNSIDVQDRPPAYVFSPNEVWDGLPGKEDNWLCNGLIRDWASWQKEGGTTYKNLCAVLLALSPSDEEPLTPGDLKRISLDDVRDMPTIRMPYNQDVPALHASSGMRRIIALAYFLVWSWEEHKKAAQLLKEPTTNQIIFLVDEIESHLHPTWQLKIIRALLEVMKALAPTTQVQLITATHSPLVMVSVESYFDENLDAWFDLDYSEENPGIVILTKRSFEPHGDVSNWLTSEAFDLPSAVNPEYAMLMTEASHLLEDTNISQDRVAEMHSRLIKALNPKDTFLFRWRAIAAKKGLLP